MKKNPETVFDSLQDDFIHGIVAPDTTVETCYWFLFDEDEILVEKKGAQFEIIETQGKENSLVPVDHPQYMGNYRGHLCFCASIRRDSAQPSFSFIKLRALFDHVTAPIFALAARAFQIIDWVQTHKYCGMCANPTGILAGERATVCPQCGLTNYPRISPAVLVAVIRGETILLAWSKRMTEPRYSVIAGFVEPGETLEQCVMREVKEETGITVGSVEYFGSQPWPFPHSLMIAFTASYKSGEIKIDEQELRDAQWFSRQNMPLIPSSISLSRKLIDWFIHDH